MSDMILEERKSVDSINEILRNNKRSVIVVDRKLLEVYRHNLLTIIFQN